MEYLQKSLQNYRTSTSILDGITKNREYPYAKDDGLRQRKYIWIVFSRP